MINDYFTINIHEYLISDELKTVLDKLLASFDCSEKNEEVDGLLKGSAVTFAEKGQSATYLFFADENNPRLVGYFTLSIKPITVPVASVSSKNAKKIDGNTNFKVRVLFSESATETMEDKILRIVRNSGDHFEEKYDIMAVPQMSRQSERSA